MLSRRCVPIEPSAVTLVQHPLSVALCLSLQPCFGNSTTGDQSNGKWTLPAALLIVDKLHSFAVTVSKASATDTRTGTNTISLTPRLAQLPIPTGSIQRLCGGMCSPKHSTDSPLSLLLKLAPGFEAATVAWRSDQIANISTTALQLTLQPQQLPTTDSLTVTASMTLNQVTGSTSITVPLNSRPACGTTQQGSQSKTSAAGGCADVSSTSDVFPTASFTSSASSYQDTDKLRWALDSTPQNVEHTFC